MHFAPVRRRATPPPLPLLHRLPLSRRQQNTLHHSVQTQTKHRWPSSLAAPRASGWRSRGSSVRVAVTMIDLCGGGGKS